ncbi:MAG: glycoside hydrolase family 15 protein [Firmicutes bacterium]|nr:glycoside hydrolase family 15 protein [Bacillota bacterium]
MQDLVRSSVNVIKENQSPNGAYVASPNFANYRYSWLRDGAFIAFGMAAAGEYDSAEKFLRWAGAAVICQEPRFAGLLAKKREGKPIEPHEFLPTRYRLDGSIEEDGWPNHQLDGYGAWIWALAGYIELSGDQALLAGLLPAVNMSADYIAAFWNIPCYDCWEEFGDKIHLSTLACLYGGLQAAADLTGRRELLATAGRIRQFILENGVADSHFVKHLGWPEVDASLLWLAIPFRVFAPDHPLLQATVAEIERTLAAGGVKRYAKDTYYGGGEWIILTAWLGWYYTEMGRDAEARKLLRWIEARAGANGWLPEQVPENLNNPEFYPVWQKRWGAIANPLLWSHAMYLVLQFALKNNLSDRGQADAEAAR